MKISLLEVSISPNFYSFLIIIILLLFVADKGSAGQNDCRETKCGENGPPIRFPFRLKDSQPAHCGFPGFDLSCSIWNETTLEFPKMQMKFVVKDIFYESRIIQLKKSDNCFEKQNLKLLNLSFSPFDFSFYSGSTLYNCSSNRRFGPYLREPIPCLSDHRYSVHVSCSCVGSRYYLHELVSCAKMFDIPTIPPEIFWGSTLLRWSKPNCSYCEAKGEGCRLKQPGAESETECFKEFEPGKGAQLEKDPMIAGAISCSFVVILGIINAVLYMYAKNKRDRENRLRIEKFLEDYKAFKPSRYTYADIKKITNHFKEKLGQGAYGIVFKGKLSNDILVAVKILNISKEKGEEFISEVSTMGRIHHVNIARLVGYCADGFRRALVYEFLPNDSLEKHISPAAGGANHSLSWEKLQDIALGIAKGIEYLHQGCEQRIVHFDIKPHNVLLDENFNPKISDFGLAKLCSKDQSIVSMTTARGTMGYIAPEVFSRNFGNVSYKSDVYSFGMLLLEMVGGRKNTSVTDNNTEQIYYPEWIYNLLEEGDDLRIHIAKEEDAKIAEKLAMIGLWCIQWHPVSRPTMKAVVQMLEGGEELTMPPNPFASSGASKTSVRMTTRRMPLELEAVAE
ncbi:Serine/threonine protein kinase [Parasponia andersonii]|uniref:non-specific serine/threonine protein kinase n=1 Tax=Parasponia andersonii TaxID=3476 RepID=A0A2P5AS45_PARAD|nr:Serine/threonine protein kinase [Parasponia andersonii]